MNDDDFCLEHGREWMRSDRGPIPYCSMCEYEHILDYLTDVTDRIGAGEEGLGELQEDLILEMNSHPCNGHLST